MAVSDPASSNDMSLLLRYVGPSVSDGKMSVYDAASNMVAFSDFVVVAAHAIYGADSEVKAEVSAFREGSFVTDLLFHVAGAGAAVWAASPDLGGLLVTVKESLGLWRFLKGKAPKAVQHRDHRHVEVTNCDGQVTIVQVESLHVTLDAKAGIAVDQFVGKALSKAGVDAVDIGTKAERLVAVNRQDAEYYRAIEAEETVSEAIVELALMVDQPGFRDGLKWRFSDGDQNFAASVEDPIFLAAVDAGEAFRKGDTLVCDVRIRQTLSAGGTLKIERAVVLVKRHVERPNQTTLQIGD